MGRNFYNFLGRRNANKAGGCEQKISICFIIHTPSNEEERACTRRVTEENSSDLYFTLPNYIIMISYTYMQ